MNQNQNICKYQASTRNKISETGTDHRLLWNGGIYERSLSLKVPDLGEGACKELRAISWPFNSLLQEHGMAALPDWLLKQDPKGISYKLW